MLIVSITHTWSREVRPIPTETMLMVVQAKEPFLHNSKEFLLDIGLNAGKNRLIIIYNYLQGNSSETNATFNNT